ncbi:MAG TPA: hypothetical protein VHH92_03080, partial [Actinomycetota bacterium]|nr:hypothetical protein [Actinomycetota bacterium]
MWRRRGHDVLILCQQRYTERLPFVDLWSRSDGRGGVEVITDGRPDASGRVTVTNPDIGELLPVFVEDHYEGFTVKRFVDLTDDELEVYLDRNVEALADAAADGPDAIVVGHVVPGPVIGRRALGDGYVAKVHGSDLEYAVRLQDRYADLAREGLERARAVVGASRDVLARTVDAVPAVADRTLVIPPGVDVERWRPRLRVEALTQAANLLDHDLDTVHGRPTEADRVVSRAARDRDGPAVEGVARTYDQAVPDPEAAERVRALAEYAGPLVGYL